MHAAEPIAIADRLPAPTVVNGVVMVAARGAIELRLYGDCTNDDRSLLSHSEADGLQAVVMGRLHYRTEAARRIGETQPGSDAALALRTYRHGGVEALERLEGEFTLLLADRTAGRIIAVRDPHGGYPVFWLQQAGMIALGTSLRALTALKPDRALNIGTLAELLTLPFGEIDYYEDSVFDGIRRLASGSVLVADLARGSVTQRRYWNWQDHIVDPGTDSIAEIGERYRETLRQAVRERLRGGVAAHVSGGMDSTCVALLARDELAGRGEPVHALSLVYERLDSLTEERPYLESALDRPGLVAHRVLADELLDFDSYRDTNLHDEPFTGLYRMRGDIAMIGEASAAGCRAILTGNGADEVLDTAPFYIADLIRQGHPLKAWSEAGRWARAFNKNPWTFFGTFGMAPLVPRRLAAGIGPLLRGGRAAWNAEQEHAIAPWVKPEFAERGRLKERYAARLRNTYPSAGSVVLSDALGRIAHASGDWVRYNLAAPHNIHIAHPFRDPRVLGLGLGTRTRVRPTPEQQKQVLAEAMKTILPEMILRRRTKAHFNALYFGGIARNQPMLEDLVLASNVDTLGLFDKDVLVKCLRDAALGYRSLKGTVGLDNSLNLIQWLSQLPRWRESEVAPSRVIRIELPGAP